MGCSLLEDFPIPQCNALKSKDEYSMKGTKIFRNGKYFGEIHSKDPQTNVIKAVCVSKNRYMNGQVLLINY